MTDWQPIETAPRDGTFVDVWGVNPAGRRFPDVRWHEPDYDQDAYGATWRTSSDVPVVEHADAVATHWMPRPLPPPPKTEGGQ